MHRAPIPLLLIAGMCTGLASAGCSLLAPTDAELRESGAAGAGDALYRDMTSAPLWSTFDTTSAFKLAHDFAGGAFDGRYVYFVPSIGSVLARYDTRADFAAELAWSVFDTTGLDANAKAFAGAVFDGQYVYLVPSEGSVAVRYDTRATFGALSSWTPFDTTIVDPGAMGFFGAAFDGRYVYFAPNHNGAASDGIVTRYDTRADFEAKPSWITFDVTPLSPNHGAGGFHGAVFDGRYVYFVQHQDAGLPVGGFVTRYDTRADFGTSDSWSFFDLAWLDPGAVGFLGGAFDGRYLYVVPNHAGAPSLLGRYDTQGSFTASWSTFETTTLAAGVSGFAGAAFDGRYIYLVPHDNGSPDGIVARLDTTVSDFEGRGAWSTFDTSSVNSAAKGFTGAVFDGRYLYLVPSSGGVVARFDAKTPPSLPALPGFFGSFL